MNEQERREYDASVARAQEREAERDRIAEEVNRDRRRWNTSAAMLVRWAGLRVHVLRRAQVRALDARDLAEFRSAGATIEMIDQLISLAADDHETRDVQLDFEARAVTAVD